MFFILCYSFSDTFLVVQHHIFTSIYSSNSFMKRSYSVPMLAYCIYCVMHQWKNADKIFVNSKISKLQLCVWGTLVPLRNCSSTKCNIVDATFPGDCLLRGDAAMHMCFHRLAAADILTATTIKLMEFFHLTGTNQRDENSLEKTSSKQKHCKEKIKSAPMLFVWPRMRRDCF